MSDRTNSIQSHFFREEKQRLEYDDSAFYFFFISLLSIFLFPFTYYMLKKIVYGELDLGEGGKNCGCKTCLEKQSQRINAARKTWMRFGFFIQIALCLFLWYLFFIAAKEVKEIKPIKSFDPYEILESEAGADLKVLKSQFRKLSLKFHPDKNPDDPLAHQRFIDLSKAYKTLTDDTARANYEKYGNPDGPGSYKVAIALPRFLLEKKF